MDQIHNMSIGEPPTYMYRKISQIRNYNKKKFRLPDNPRAEDGNTVTLTVEEGRCQQKLMPVEEPLVEVDWWRAANVTA